MKVTVIPADQWVRRDEDQAVLPEWPFDDASIHAIQWRETEGEIEYKGKPKTPNERFTDPGVLQPYIDALDDYLANPPQPVPEPEPEPEPVLTTEQKLEAAGLTVAELKELFGLS